MPLTPYLTGGSFGPQQIEATTAAFDAVCKYLRLSDRADPLTEIVARKVIEIVGTGQQDPEKIRELVLLTLRSSDRESA